MSRSIGLYSADQRAVFNTTGQYLYTSIFCRRGAWSYVIGNTLGLSKALCQNAAGVSDAIGAFTTVDPTQMVDSYPSLLASDVGGPAGTTITWQNNSSSAVYTFPAGSTILYAELVWGGSYGYYCEDGLQGVDPDCVLNFADGPVFFTTPDGMVHPVTADPTTALQSQNPASNVQPYYCAGYYMRSQNVTSIFSSLANPSGTYIVGGVPATVSPFDNTHNCAGWTLAVVYLDPSNSNINNMSLFVSNQEGNHASMPQLPATVTGFCAAPSFTPGQSARILVSALEGDANKTGDQMMFGPDMLSLTPLSGPNNPVMNFFCSQINNDLGLLIDTTGTYCTYNADPFTATILPPFCRQGYDITNVDASSLILPNENTAVAIATTVGDDFMINALGIQINVTAPVIVPMKKVNGQNSVNAQVGETVTFTVTIDNTSPTEADNVLFTDILEAGLELVPGSFYVNGTPVANPNLVTGVPLGTIGSTPVTIEYRVLIVSPPASGNTFENFATASFDFIACDLTQPLVGSNNSNVVTIILPEPPSSFEGILKKCEFLNKTEYKLIATFDPSGTPGVLFYRIYDKNRVVAEIPAAGPYLFITCLDSRRDVQNYSVAAVIAGNIESTHTKLRIINE